jgi:hypothetical protein
MLIPSRIYSARSDEYLIVGAGWRTYVLRCRYPGFTPAKVQKRLTMYVPHCYMKLYSTQGL